MLGYERAGSWKHILKSSNAARVGRRGGFPTALRCKGTKHFAIAVNGFDVAGFLAHLIKTAQIWADFCRCLFSCSNRVQRKETVIHVSK